MTGVPMTVAFQKGGGCAYAIYAAGVGAKMTTGTFSSTFETNVAAMSVTVS